MASIINSHVTEFKVNAFKGNDFIEVSNKDIEGKWAVFLLLSRRFHLCLPHRVGRFAGQICTAQGNGRRGVLGELRHAFCAQGMARRFATHQKY